VFVFISCILLRFRFKRMSGRRSSAIYTRTRQK
jgi:hypothetical protein